jgi:hypothetical protein
MIASIALVVVTLVIAALYWLMRGQPNRRSLWRTALIVGVGTGVLRAALSAFGWYVVEHTGGPLQIPGFAMAMMAWPEAALLAERRLSPAPLSFYFQLSLLLVTSTVTFVALIAFIAGRRRFGRIS